MKIKHLFNIALSLFFLSFTNNLFAQVSQWIWQSGDTVANSFGNEFTATANIPSQMNFPAGRTDAAISADNAGNLWLFGGGVVSYDFGKLWRYNIQSDQWTWLAGSSPDTVPAARRRPVTWIDDAGNFWLFSGGGFIGNYPVNDFWKYDITVNKWINFPLSGMYASGIYGVQGVASPDNRPGARYGSAGWKDNDGNLWLFGGYGYGTSPSTRNIGTMNDLWKYNIATNQWTWMGGSAGTWGYEGGGGSYGTKGVASPDNYPKSRESATAQSDGKGTVWLFGNDSRLNDLWKYDAFTNQWTWMAGDTALNTNGNKGSHGSKGIASPDNTPGYRNGMCSFIDSTGNFWMFGGSGVGYDLVSSTYQYGYFNDFWVFDKKTNEWIWTDGDSTLNTMRVYGIRTVPASTNNPGGRSGMVSCIDNKGQFWMFGGVASLDGLPGFLNDLWTYKPSLVLPVTLVTFTGKIINHSAILNWTVTQSANSKGFEVQKSKDGSIFNAIGFVASTNSNTYTFTDVNLSKGTSLYRLKQVDINGRFTYSPVINLDYSSFNWNVMHNSSNTNPYIQLQLDKPSSVSVQVITINGVLVQSVNKEHLEAGSYSIPLDIHQVSSGLYVVRLIINEQSYAKKIIKN